MNPMRPGRPPLAGEPGRWGAVGLLSACASLTASQTRALLAQPPADLPARVEWTQVPFPQEINQCESGRTRGHRTAVPWVCPSRRGAGHPPVFVPAREGSLQIEMLAAPRRHGHIATRIRPDLISLLREVAAGQAPVVLLNLGLSIQPLWHYAVVVGYDLPAGEILLRSGTVQREVMPLSTFERTWSRSSRWAFVVLPPDRLPAQADEAAVTEARVASRAGRARAAGRAGVPHSLATLARLPSCWAWVWATRSMRRASCRSRGGLCPGRTTP